MLERVKHFTSISTENVLLHIRSTFKQNIPAATELKLFKKMHVM